MASPEATSRWYQALLPMAQRGGPVLTLALLIALIISVWWLAGWMHVCVERNRALTDKLLTQQQALYQEMRLALAHCQPAPDR
jgi:hypothetical protein